MLRSIVFVMQYDGDREKVYYNHALMNSEKEAVAISVGKANERTPLVLVIFLRYVDPIQLFHSTNSK